MPRLSVLAAAVESSFVKTLTIRRPRRTAFSPGSRHTLRIRQLLFGILVRFEQAGRAKPLLRSFPAIRISERLSRIMAS
ncbi:hypothetical protein ACFSR7_22100 [Cohnella sp. GCM10020058]|uniref:hypothetical protein n=1 Tax=Cohnella sp. GCM10020058 TaxID=3317330 RepID=UPI00362AB6C4